MFRDERGDGSGVVVVDWKTGPRPGPARSRERAIQLGVYALAYAELGRAGAAGHPVTTVRAAFYFARTGETQWVEVPSREQLEALLADVAIDEAGTGSADVASVG